MKKALKIGIITLTIILAAAIFLPKKEPVHESIIFFPLDPDVHFKSASTSLSLLPKAAKPIFSVQWDTSSTLDRKAYLRQDISFLFSTGRLQSKMGKWQLNTDKIVQKKMAVGKQSTLFQAITFHYAEIHKKSGPISSAQTMSANQLYVIESSNIPAYSFKNPRTAREEEWKKRLDQVSRRIIENSWRKGIRSFSIAADKYDVFPLTQFIFSGNETLPGFSLQETNRIIGNLWEGLYKNYFLGIKKRNGTTVEPVGSTIPMVMISKDKTHLLVLFEASDGEPILLRQVIEDVH